jgi:putative MATE family efflux protein
LRKPIKEVRRLQNTPGKTAAERTKMLGSGSINQLLFNFSVPAIVGMLVNASYVIINRIFIGNAVNGGKDAIAGITVTFPIMILFMAISMLVGVGATTLISLNLGQNKVKEAEEILGNALFLMFLLPFLLCAGMYMFIEPLMLMVGASEVTLPYAVKYMTILMPSLIIMSVSMGMNNIIRAEGSPVMAMSTQILGGAVNVGCNYLLVIVYPLGVQGAALGAVLGQICSVIWVMSYFLMPGRSLLRIRLKNLKLRPAVITSVCTVGLAPFLMQVTASIQQFILNIVLQQHGGDMALTAFGIVGSLSQILVMPLVGLSQGAQPIIGYNYGAHRMDRVREVLLKAVAWATVFATFSWIIIQTSSARLVSIFLANEPETSALAAHALRCFFAVLFVIGFQVICSGYFQAIGKPRQAAFLTLSRQILFFIPLLLILPRFTGLEGVWISPPIADAASSLITACFILIEMRNSGMLRGQASMDEK